MEQFLALSYFFSAADRDARIGPLHISLYAAILQLWIENGGRQPIVFKRESLMSLSRIAGTTTYHRVLGDLVEHGYIGYEGRYDRKGSLIYLRHHGIKETCL